MHRAKSWLLFDDFFVTFFSYGFSFFFFQPGEPGIPGPRGSRGVPVSTDKSYVINYEYSRLSDRDCCKTSLPRRHSFGSSRNLSSPTFVG